MSRATERAMAAPKSPPQLKGRALVLAVLILSLSNFMVVLDLTIANVLGAAHRRQSGYFPGSGDVGYHILCGGGGDMRSVDRLAGQALRHRPTIQLEHGGFRNLLAGLRTVADARRAHRRPHRPGPLRWPVDAAFADPAVAALPTGKARQDHGTLGDDDADRPGGRPDTRRLHQRQLELALDFLHQYPGGRRFAPLAQ